MLWHSFYIKPASPLNGELLINRLVMEKNVFAEEWTHPAIATTDHPLFSFARKRGLGKGAKTNGAKSIIKLVFLRNEGSVIFSPSFRRRRREGAPA